MSGNQKLSAQTRDLSVKARDIRTQKRIPAVVYGHEFANQHVHFDYVEFYKLFQQTGRSEIFNLEVDGKKIPVLITEVQYHPVTDDIIHVDFYVIRMDQEMEAHVPVYLEGNPIAVREKWGITMQNVESLTVRCMPKDLPHDFTLDIEHLEEIHSHMTVADLTLPKGVEIIEEPETVIVTIAQTRGAADEKSEEEASEAPEEEEAIQEKSKE